MGPTATSILHGKSRRPKGPPVAIALARKLRTARDAASAEVFWSRLRERGLASALDGEGSVNFDPAGVVYECGLVQSSVRRADGCAMDDPLSDRRV